jgi:hypothetical protein
MEPGAITLEPKFDVTMSAEVGELAAALAKAQAEMKPATLDKVNPHFRSKYASLASCLEAARPLAKHGIAVAQIPEQEEAGLHLSTMLIHSSGQWMKGRMKVLAAQQTAQGIGSGLSYARRYSLSAMAGIAADEDDDAEEATRPAREERPPVRMVQKKAVNAPPPDVPLGDVISENRQRERDDGLPSDYVIDFGRFEGKRLSEIELPELKSYFDWVRNDTLKKKKPAEGRIATFLAQAERYLEEA